MIKITWPSKYAISLGGKLHMFTAAGTYITDDEAVIEYLSSKPWFAIEWKVEKKVKEVIKEEVIDEETDTRDLSAEYMEKFGKKVPNNKKNDNERIEKKLAE